MVRLLYFCLFQLSHQHWRCNLGRRILSKTVVFQVSKHGGVKPNNLYFWGIQQDIYIYIDIAAYIATIPLQPIHQNGLAYRGTDYHRLV